MSENPDFIVVGIVGAGSVGKSFILNSVIKLSNNQSINPDDSSNYNADGQSKPQAERTFRVQTFEKQMLSEHCTYSLLIPIFKILGLSKICSTYILVFFFRY